MNIQNLASILGTKLLSEPIISEISGFCFNERKARAGECFFAPSLEAAKIAVNNGAYAIVGDFEPFDSEVAFLRCLDTNTAILRLLRYEISQKNIKIVLANRIQMSLLRCFSGDFSLLPARLDEAYFALKKASLDEIFFSSAEFKNLSFESRELGLIKSIKSTSCSLFYSDFVFASRRYELALSPVFLPDLLGILDFFASKDFDYRGFGLKDFRDFELLKPLFVGVDNQPLTASNRAFICAKDEEIFNFAYKFFAKIETDLPLALPWDSSLSGLAEAKITSFKALSELKELSFKRFCLVLCDFSELKEALKPQEKLENTLF